MEPSLSLVRTTTTPVARGFTLIEMLVVLSIIAIITTIALFGQSTFNRSILLTDAAYTVALSLREMQSLGLSSRKFGGIQNAGYGGSFSGATASYTLFADIDGSSPQSNCPAGQSLESGNPEKKPGNCVYESDLDGLVRTYSLSRGFTIAEICGTALSNGTRYCSTDGTPLSALDIVFVRSNTTDTIMTARRSGALVPLSKAEIYLTDADAVSLRGVCISQLGQVSVSYSVCP